MEFILDIIGTFKKNVSLLLYLAVNCKKPKPKELTMDNALIMAYNEDDEDALKKINNSSLEDYVHDTKDCSFYLRWKDGSIKCVTVSSDT